MNEWPKRARDELVKSPAVDAFGRPLRDLRISVTDRCSCRCVYCMPKEIFGRAFEARLAPQVSERLG